MTEIRAAEALNLQHRPPPPLGDGAHANVLGANQAGVNITVTEGRSPSPSPSPRLTRSHKRPARNTKRQ